MNNSGFLYLDQSGLSPNIDRSQLIRNDQSGWQEEHENDLNSKLSGIDFVEEESEDQYSERPIDGKSHCLLHHVTVFVHSTGP